MDLPAGKLVINGAPSQLDRWLRALRDEYVRVDERSFSELLDFASRFGGLIYFYNLENERDGDWVEFFEADPTLALASIEAIHQAELEALFHRLQSEASEAWGFDAAFRLLRELFQLILRLARQMDAWLRGAIQGQDNPVARQLQQLLVTAIEGELGEQLRTLKAYDEGAGLPRALGQPIGLDYSGLLPLWDLEHVRPDGSIYQGAAKERRIRAALPRLDPIFEAFLYAITSIQEFARAQLPATLENGQHSPHIALYIAFVRLFQKAQDTINTMSRRYSRLYYRDVLRDQRKAAIPDSVYLTLTLAEDEEVRSTTVPKGALFSAGQDSAGQDILYASDKALAVTRASIASLRALRVICGPLLPESSASNSQVIQRILASEMPIGDAQEEEAPAPWATFGERRVGKTASAVTEPATLGFAISSTYLLLSGGERRVALTVRLTDKSVQEKLLPLLQELSTATGMDSGAILTQVLGGAFSLYISTAAGWLPVDSYTAEPLPSAEGYLGFTLSVLLPASVPPIVAYDPEGADDTESPIPVSKSPSVLATNPAPGLPTLKAYLRGKPVELTPTVPVHPLSLLTVMEAEAFTLKVAVSGLTNLRVENTDGEIDPSTTFPLFGATPVVGSFMQLRHPELFVKRLETFQLDLTWFDLPRDLTGFTGYYRDYVIGPNGTRRPKPLFTNQSFQADLRVLNPGTWKIDQPKPSYLFRTKCPEDPKDPHSPLKCQPSPPAPSAPLCGDTSYNDLAIVDEEPPDYYDPSLSSIRLELTAPSYAFGNSIYSQNVLNSVMEELPNSAACTEACLQRCAGKVGEEYERCLKSCMDECMKPKEVKYPNAPYMPQLQKLSVQYSATCTLPATEPAQATGALFHLEPFDGYRSLASAPGQAMPLLPRFAYAGNLYLGFSELIPPQTLTLLFQMSGAPGEQQSDKLPPVAWDYLSADQWVCLTAAQLRADTTNGLQNTGLVDLGLPSYKPVDSTLMPSDPGTSPLQWLRAAVDDEPARILGGQKVPVRNDRKPDRFPRTVAITPHAVLASWQPSAGTGEHLSKPLPPYTITSAYEDLPDIATIDQPMESFGGRPPETEQSFEVRVGERLRHKDRALLEWDYERLVLDRFPAIWKVQALPAHSPRKKNDPGHVLVVVVPGQDGTAVDDPTVPQVAGDMLARIQDWLQGLTSPFVKLHVVNPVYVRIQVEAAVMFRDEEDPGASLQRLNDDLVGYLSPWFYDAARAARGGQYASESDISEFIQTRPYVAAVDTLKFHYSPKSSELGSDWCFLTSAEKHDLTIPGGDPCKESST